MAFKELADLDASVTTALGGKNKKTGKANPTEIEGYYIGSRQVPSPKAKSGFAALHIFQTQDGNVGVWGKTNLDQKLSNVAPGTMTRVKFTGMKETKNNPMYVFSVAVDTENTIEVSAPSSQPEQDNGSEQPAGGVDDDTYDSLDAEDDVADELPPQRPQAPRKAATPPAANVNRVQQLLASRKASA